MPDTLDSMATIHTPTVENQEHYETWNGYWEKKASVGRKDHSAMGRTLYSMLRPIVKQLGCVVEQEWTIIHGDRKIIPDVTLSHPSPQIEAGYLVAPALLAVESRSPRQSLSSLIEKCKDGHHSMGTRYCWIIDIEERNGYECHLGDREARQVATMSCNQILSLSVAAVFSNFDDQNDSS